MANEQGDFQDGYKKEDSSNLNNDLKDLNNTLRSLAMALTRITNNEMFSKKDYLEKTLDKFGGTLKDKVYKPMSDAVANSASSTAEFIDKTTKILSETSKYIKEELGIRDITKKQMQMLLDAEKTRMAFQKELLTVTRNQDQLLQNVYTQTERIRQEKTLDYTTRKRSSNALQPEDRLINKAVSKTNNKNG